MTEAEWLACTDPRPMLRSLIMRLRAHANGQSGTNLERFRYFACACCRRIWHLLRQEDKEAVQILEAYIRSLDHKELLKARKAHRPAGNQASNEMSQVSRDHPGNEPLLLTAWAKNLATSAVWEATAKKPTRSANTHLSAARAVGSLQQAASKAERRESSFVHTHTIDWLIVSEDELAVQTALLRDIFGNPFRPASVDASWLAWNDGTVVKLAQTMYDTRDFSAMPILGDALEEAGCTNDDILRHCRDGKDHVRGCWMVDLVLGKE